MAVGWWSPLYEFSLKGQGLIYQSEDLKEEGIFNGQSFNYNKKPETQI